MRPIGIGIIGGGYMGKAHSVAMHAVGAVFNTVLRPICEMICTTTEDGAALKARELGFARSTSDWRILVNDPKVEAIIVATPQTYHREIVLASIELGKSVLCEKPLGASLADSREMTAAAEKAGVVNMVGFNYIRTPASQYARKLIAEGAIGEVTYFKGEHTEDFFADPSAPASWRTKGRQNGTMGDLAPHMINGALALIGPITSISADIVTVHTERPGPSGMEPVTNDDHAHFLCRFGNGAMGHLYFSRIATGRKMGYAYEAYGTKGTIRFDQEDQNAVWLYRMEGDEASRCFTKILIGPAHHDYVNFCLGPGHGTGYQDLIIIEAKDFLTAIETNQTVWPTFRDGMLVNEIIEAAWCSYENKSWVSVSKI